MNSLRNVVLLQLKTNKSLRLLSGSLDKGDSNTSQDKGKKNKDKKKDVCGKDVKATGPRCKNKPGDDKSKDKDTKPEE